MKFKTKRKKSLASMKKSGELLSRSFVLSEIEQMINAYKNYMEARYEDKKVIEKWVVGMEMVLNQIRIMEE